MTHEYAMAPGRAQRTPATGRSVPRPAPLRIHQLAGNRAFGSLWAKLTINQPGDAYEVEADRVADQVMRMSTPRVQRTCACGGTCDDCKNEEEEGHLHRTTTSAVPAVSGLAGAPAAVHNVLHTRGEPLDIATRAFMETRFAHDFGNVRIHHDAAAVASARAIDARAYTVNNHVVFGEHQYRPTNADGQRLLAHELTHTLQQGAKSPLPSDVVQREPAGRGVPGVTFEKWSPDVERTYRQAGLTEAADAVKHCRESISCVKVLTESEAYTAYRTGRLSAGMSDPGSTALAGAMVAPSLVPGGAATGEAAAESALARAGLRWGTAEVIEGGLGAGEAAAAGSAATLGTVLVPIAVGVYVVIAIIDLFGYASFQQALRKLGYVVLPSPLGVCIGLCHTGPRPRTPEVVPEPPTTPVFPRRIPDEDLDRIRDWVKRTTPREEPKTSAPPVPLPKPKKKEDEERAKCKLVRRAVPRGNDPLSEIFCSVAMPGAPSYDIYSPAGIAEIDALAGRTWYECKCGYGSLVRAAEHGERWAQFALWSLDEQIRRHMRIAAVCGLDYRFIVSREDVAQLVRSRHWDVDVIVFGWEPCE